MEKIEIHINPYAMKVECDLEAIIYLARVKVENNSIKLYYNCSKDSVCKDGECVFKSYLREWR